MKNFRKVLALILVVATLFSFVAMASAKTADEYTDYADVKYVEAVDVLTAIGITEGYAGAYHPADPIDRDEVAAMIARLRNGGDVDADLYVGADNVFADVKGQWSEGYVTYCAQLGIINGRNASTFDPDGKVTGTEVMKMLLCVLGYDAAEQGYTGANWQVNVVRDAAKAGLLIDDVDPYKAATRDEVAQYFLNALNARMVIGYLGEGLVKLTNSIWVDMFNWFNMYEIITPDSVNGGVEVTYCNAVLSGDFLWESIKGLNATEYEEDCLKRPGHKWTITAANGKVTTIGFYADAPLWSTAAPTEANMKAALKAADDDFAYGNAFCYVDGAYSAEFKYGNGIETELYETEDGYRFVQVNTYIGKVTDVNSYAETFTVNNHTFKLGDAELAEKDYVLYQFCDGTDPVHASANACSCGDNLHSVTVVKPIAVEVTAGDLYSDANYSCIYDAGKTYYYSANLGKEIDNGDNVVTDALKAADIKADGTEWNLYLDQNGYIAYYAPVTAETVYEYAYLVEKTASKTNYVETVGVGEWDYAADLVKYAADGALAATEDVAISAALYNEATANYHWDVYAGEQKGNVGTLIKYSYNSDGDFVFEAEGKFAKAGTKVSNTEYELGTSLTGKKIVATSKTIFMVRTKGLDGKYVYNQYTGFAKLPGEYTAKDLYGNRTNIQYFYDEDATAALNNDYRFATYVFIDAMYQKAAADHFFTLGTVDYKRFESALVETGLFTNDYFVYDGFVDGVRAVIASDEQLDKGAFYDAATTYLFDVTIGGKQYPLYANVSKINTPNYKITFNYVVGADEVYVGLTDLTVTPNKDILPTLAKDAKIFILGGKTNSAGDRVLTIKSALGEYADYIEAGEKSGYVVLNKDKSQVTELYIIDASYTAEEIDIWN